MNQVASEAQDLATSSQLDMADELAGTTHSHSSQVFVQPVS